MILSNKERAGKMKYLKKMTRLKKKLLIYFLLIAIVSISVSGEMILEISSTRFRESIKSNISHEVKRILAHEKNFYDSSGLDFSNILKPVTDLRNRMILFLLIVFVSIISSFVLFTKDIVSPMDGIVDATKKIAEGNLAVRVPVRSEDEIGQIASLINDINDKQNEMINQIRTEINRHRGILFESFDKIVSVISEQRREEIFESGRIKSSDLKRMIAAGKDVSQNIRQMVADFSELQVFLSMYKTYAMKTEISQREIDKVISGYKTSLDKPAKE